MSELDKDFQKLVKQINQKIKDASLAMKEANKLVKKAGMPGMTLHAAPNGLSDEELDELESKVIEIDIYPLFRELDKAGWSTSSLNCPGF
jgi:hypothetical protein